jgi:hypothetical protein
LPKFNPAVFDAYLEMIAFVNIDTEYRYGGLDWEVNSRSKFSYGVNLVLSGMNGEVSAPVDGG